MCIRFYFIFWFSRWVQVYLNIFVWLQNLISRVLRDQVFKKHFDPQPSLPEWIFIKKIYRNLKSTTLKVDQFEFRSLINVYWAQWAAMFVKTDLRFTLSRLSNCIFIIQNYLYIITRNQVMGGGGWSTP